MKIRHQIYTVACLITLLVGINIGVMYFSSEMLSNSMRQLSQKYLIGVQSVLAAEASLNRAVSTERTIILVAPAKPLFSSLKTYHKNNIEKATALLEKLQTLKLPDVDAGLLEKGETSLRQWQQLSLEVFTLREQNTRESRRAALKLTMEDSNFEFAVLKDVMTELIGQINQGAANVVAATENKQRDVKTITTVIAFFSVLCVLFTSVFLVRSIVRPINRLKRDFDDIANGQGDLTKRIPVKGDDELSDLAKTFNQFCENQGELINEIKATLTQVSSSSTNVVLSMVETQDNATAQKEDSDQVNNNMTTMRSSIDTIQDSTEGALSLSHQVRLVVEAADNSLSEAGETIEGMIDEVGKIATAIEDLSGCTKNIERVTGSIHEIAEQTNLLSLNAAIEAARAQQHGRGFAVVAGEVRNLSNVTQKLTKDIGVNLKLLLEASSRANEVMARSLTHSRMLNDRATAIRRLMAEINQTSEQQLVANQTVSEQVKDQQLIVSETTQRVNTLKSLADKASHCSVLVSEKMVVLQDDALGLHQLLNQFKTQ